MKWFRKILCKILGHRWGYYDKETEYNGVRRIVFCPRCRIGDSRPSKK